MDEKLRKNLGQILSVGFHGKTSADEGVQNVLAQARAGLIGGVILYRYNIESAEQLTELLSLFHHIECEYPLFVMLDQEGGKVQRLHSKNGFQDFLSAQQVAQEMTCEEAYNHYRAMGKMLRAAGFNFNFAPCVDLDCDPPCEVIGKIGRSYSADPARVINYARAMITGLKDEGIASCLKHFPGHGSARGDSHMGMVDITSTWREDELIPYRELTKEGMIDSIMSAHLIHNTVDPETPVVFSAKWLARIREDIKFDGVIVTDDLHMGAIIHNFTVQEITTRTINAGHDLLIFSNNPLASQTQGIRHDENQQATTGPLAKLTVPDPALPEKILQQIESSLESGEISQVRLAESVERVLILKQHLKHSTLSVTDGA